MFSIFKRKKSGPAESSEQASTQTEGQDADAVRDTRESEPLSPVQTLQDDPLAAVAPPVDAAHEQPAEVIAPVEPAAPEPEAEPSSEQEAEPKLQSEPRSEEHTSELQS